MSQLVTVVTISFGGGASGGGIVLIAAVPLSLVAPYLAKVHRYCDIVVGPWGVGGVILGAALLLLG